MDFGSGSSTQKHFPQRVLQLGKPWSQLRKRSNETQDQPPLVGAQPRLLSALGLAARRVNGQRPDSARVFILPDSEIVI